MTLVETTHDNINRLPVRQAAPGFDVFASPAAFEHAQRVAKVFASSKLIPKHLQGNVADCLIALQIAWRFNEDPFQVMQNIYVVNGRPGWKTDYCNARVIKSGVFSDRIDWKVSGEGKTLSVTAFATLANNGVRVEATADMRMAIAEGWTRNEKYSSMPEHMLKWRSAAMLIRLYAPEVMLGMPNVVELETMPAEQQPRDVSPKTVAQALDAFAAEANQADAERIDPETGEIIGASAAPTEKPDPSALPQQGSAAHEVGAAPLTDAQIEERLEAAAKLGNDMLTSEWKVVRLELDPERRTSWNTRLQNEFRPIADEADKQRDMFPGDRP